MAIEHPRPWLEGIVQAVPGVVHYEGVIAVLRRCGPDRVEPADIGGGDVAKIGKAITRTVRPFYDIQKQMCSIGGLVQIGKWGNSLAVRLPASVVDALGLKEGDEIEIEIAGERVFRVARDRTREDALARLMALRWTPPPGFRFSREEANERGTDEGDR